LRRQAERLGINARVEWRGAQPHDLVLEALREADLFVLASRVAPDGDRDGLPNVLLEAQSQGLACLATAVSAIPELILDGVTGCLVPPDDPEALAEALARLIRDPELRGRLAKAAERRLHENFDMTAGIDRLAKRLAAEPVLPSKAAQGEPV
jgi:glycosyltransferase involved in cell wall biosynthesis